jgi:propionyl-CoA carboxylase alpha chain
VEEAPSAVLTPEIRAEMGRCAVDVARACGYYGAGTVEFIVDDQLNFYFLEMNTRLQVEHPVTEQITGVDLVKQMIYIAEGKELTIKQEDLEIKGHAVEVRVYAEDPTNNFLPDVGTLQTYVRPQGNGVRVDDGFEQGMEIPIYYDPMIAKLITYGNDRTEAIQKMIRAIDEYQITGVQTTLPFCRYVMEHPAFTSGNFDTHFVNRYFTPDVLKPAPDAAETQLAAVLAAQLFANRKPVAANGTAVTEAKVSRWKANRR